MIDDNALTTNAGLVVAVAKGDCAIVRRPDREGILSMRRAPTGRLCKNVNGQDGTFSDAVVRQMENGAKADG